MNIIIKGRRIVWHLPSSRTAKFFIAAGLAACSLLSQSPAVQSADHSPAVLSAVEPASGDTAAVPGSPKIMPVRATVKRSADSDDMSPAMALALALGVRDISGPMRHTPRDRMDQ